MGSLALHYLRQSSDWDLNDPANEEEFLKNWRWPDAIDIMINGHKALMQKTYWDDLMTTGSEDLYTGNLYYWVQDGNAIFLSIPAWLLERYPEETFFDIVKVEIEERDGIK